MRVLITDDLARSTLFSDRTDEELATVLSELNRFARQEGFRFDGWWGIDDPIVTKFIAEHLKAD